VQYRFLPLVLIFGLVFCAAEAEGLAVVKQDDNFPGHSMPPEVWAEETAELPEAAVGAQVVRGGNELGFRLFSSLFAADPTGNIFVSPTSITMALAMTWNGAEAGTRDAMADVLGFTGREQADISIANAALLAALK